MPIRFRLALWYAAVLLGGLIALAAVTSFTLSRLLLADIDASLKKWAKGAETVLTNEAATQPLDRVQDEIQEYSSTLPEGSVLRVQDLQNRDFFYTDPAIALHLPTIPEGPVHGTAVYSTISLYRFEYRLLNQPSLARREVQEATRRKRTRHSSSGSEIVSPSSRATRGGFGVRKGYGFCTTAPRLLRPGAPSSIHRLQLLLLASCYQRS